MYTRKIKIIKKASNADPIEGVEIWIYWKRTNWIVNNVEMWIQVERLFESTGPPAYSPLFQWVRLSLVARGPSAAASLAAALSPLASKPNLTHWNKGE